MEMLRKVQDDAQNTQQPAAEKKQMEKRPQNDVNDNPSPSASTIPGYHTKTESLSPNPRPPSKPRRDQTSSVEGDMKQRRAAPVQPSRQSQYAQKNLLNTGQSQVNRSANAARNGAQETKVQTVSNPATSRNNTADNRTTRPGYQQNQNKEVAARKVQKQPAKDRETLSTTNQAQKSATGRDRDVPDRQRTNSPNKPSAAQKPVKRTVRQSV